MTQLEQVALEDPACLAALKRWRPFAPFPPLNTLWLLIIQALKVETSPGVVEKCHMTQLEQVASEESARLAAINHVAPIHTFMFSNTGRLLLANRRGRERYNHLSECLSHSACLTWVSW